ncbi:MAG: acyltransferase [Chitinophagaceae bacterium]|nr:acyltransferase [Chitinophagaceae bacterium]MCW5905094.1 acyltransferase [Chitinophagaceae bacterium]
MRTIVALYKKCKKSDSSFIMVFTRLLINQFIYKKTILLHQKVTLKGIRNIQCHKKIEIGIGYVGFMHKTDKTFLNINGHLNIKGNYNIGRGCRFDIGKNATVSIGDGGYINCNSSVIIMHKLSIGDNCAISWNCQFLDEDFHVIDYEGKKNTPNSIEIGNHVWIGCGVKVYKGTKIPDGCVIASDSVVKGIFDKQNCLIGGNPAKILQENIQWE